MRSYNAEIYIAALAGAKTLLLLENAADHVTRIDTARITNASVDANEQLYAGLFRCTTKGSPVGTSVTPEQRDQGDAASSVTVLGNLTTEPTAYAAVGHHRSGWSNVNGFLFEPILGTEIWIPPSGLVGLRLLAAPAAGFDCVAEVAFTEIG